MSYQLLEQMEEWEEETDKLLVALPVAGCMFRKTYYCPVKKRNVSEVKFPTDIVVDYYAKSIESANRVSDTYDLYPNDIEERIRSGIFSDFEYAEKSERSGEKTDGAGTTETPPASDVDAPHEFIEQHRWWDLDDDGYQEPYIVTVHRATQEVVRIVARYAAEGIEVNEKGRISSIKPIHYITKYGFIPAMDGGFYDIGFGQLLLPANKTINTVINQLLDAGTMSNVQGGFLGKGITLGRGKSAGPLTFELGEWKQVNIPGDDLRKGIVPLPMKEPSMVLFQLLGLMIESGEKLSSVSDAMTGVSPGSNVPATSTLALIEQGS